MPSPSSSSPSLTERIMVDLPVRMAEVHTHNVDYRRFSMWMPPARVRALRTRLALRDLAFEVARRLGVVRLSAKSVAKIGERMGVYAALLADLEPFYRKLTDDRSRDVMVETILYRILGDKHVKLSRNDDAFWRAYDHLDSYRTGGPSVYAGKVELPELSVRENGRTIKLHTHELGVFNAFCLQQFVCDRPGFSVRPTPGDVVIDGGGCWGDTTLWFAEQVGDRGHVYVFEFVPDNLTVLEKNLAMNPELTGRVTVVKAPLWNVAGETLAWSSGGPASRVGVGSESTITDTIDHLASSRNLARVDFLKLDIEGAELSALQGSAETIVRCQPKLAISVYHKDDDLKVIPSYIESLGVKYRWALEHFTIHSEETMLFGLPEGR